MKKGEIYEGTVERIEFPNKGVVVIDGEKAIVKNALPGQKIRFRINKKRGGRCEGMLLEVVEHSKLETAEDICPHFGICGGCLYQPIPYEKQLAIKEKQVRSLLDAVCPEYEFEGILGSPLVQGYRNKMEFSFGDEVKDGPMSLGMHKRGSFYDVVTTGECHIVHPDFCKILVCTKEYFEEKKVGFYKKMQHTGYLRHLLVRRAIKTGEILVDLITTTQTDTFEGTEETLLRGWTERLQALPMEGSFAGILHTKNDTLADAVKDEGDGDDDRGVKMLGDPIVDQQTDDADRQHSDQHLCPQLEGGVTLCARFGRCKGIELVEVENHHRQDGAELDDHKEHIHKVFGLVEL